MAVCAREIGIKLDKTTLLLMTGGAGIAGDQMVERLLDLAGDFQVVAVAGRNQQLLGNYQSIAGANPTRLFPLGFTRTIERVMACADIAVTKHDGLTMSECLAVKLPIPGQEERNADYLMEQGAALKAPIPPLWNTRWASCSLAESCSHECVRTCAVLAVRTRRGLRWTTC